MKYESKIYVEKWINDGVKICLDKYEAKELFMELKLRKRLCDKALNLPGQRMTEIETKIYEVLKPVVEGIDKTEQKETTNRINNTQFNSIKEMDGRIFNDGKMGIRDEIMWTLNT